MSGVLVYESRREANRYEKEKNSRQESLERLFQTTPSLYLHLKPLGQDDPDPHVAH